MLLNLASEKPFIFLDNNFYNFDRKNLEEQLPKFFYDNKDRITNLYVINGPGYFSSTRVGVEVVNILLSLNIFKRLYFLDKISFFKQKSYDKIYLFSGNKNKFILLSSGDYKMVNKSDLDYNLSFEQLYDLSLDKSCKYILYKDLLKDYKLLNWTLLENKQLLKPYYIFEPIITC